MLFQEDVGCPVYYQFTLIGIVTEINAFQNYGLMIMPQSTSYTFTLY